MSITDELREWFKDRLFMANGWQEIRDIADRIDAEHEAKVSYWQGASYKDGYDDGFASADDWLADHEDAMAEHGWVKLPVSEDGDVLHVGELVDEKLPFGGYAAPAPIDTMELSRGASGYRWMVKLDAESRALISPKLLRHHHKPTVEDVLRDVVTLCHNTWKEESPFHFYDVDDVMKSGNIAEFAARLRLAKEDE